MRRNWRQVKSYSLTDEEVAVRLYNSAKNKSAKRGLEFTLEYYDVLERVKGGKCEVTGIPFDQRAKPYRGVDLPFRASLDRVDNTRGYHKDNIMVVCKLFNHAKYMWNTEDVLYMARKLVEGTDET